MWMMLQQDEPRDYVIGTGESHTIRELCEVAFGRVGLDWEAFVRIDERYFRPVEVERLRSDPTRANDELGWKPEVTFQELIAEMVDADLEAHGFTLEQARAAADSSEEAADDRGPALRADGEADLGRWAPRHGGLRHRAAAGG
jgi:GDPmannose 4,6-dehydratase